MFRGRRAVTIVNIEESSLAMARKLAAAGVETMLADSKSVAVARVNGLFDVGSTDIASARLARLVRGTTDFASALRSSHLAFVQLHGSGAALLRHACDTAYLLGGALEGSRFYRIVLCEENLRFDHDLRAYLVARGVPTAAAVPTRDGRRWTRTDVGVYELYPFVCGRPFAAECEEEVAAAARALAEFHQVAAGYRPALPRKEPILQYASLGFSEAASERMDDPHLQRLNLAQPLIRASALSAFISKPALTT